MNEKMKAAVLYGPYNMAVEDVDKPKVDAGEVLVKVRATGICGTDVETYHGKYPVKYPIIMGHEAAGEVVQVGEKVEKVSVGDKVVIDPIFHCGKCYLCLMGKRNLCINGGLLGRDIGSGAYAEYTVLPENYVFKIPDNISYEEASMIQLLTTVYHSQKRIRIIPNNSIAILGQGAAGLLHTRLAKLSGGKPVMVTARSDWKLELAKKYGADITINSKIEDPVRAILENTNGRGADVVIEAVGSLETFKQAINAVRPGGTILSFGVLTEQINGLSLFPLYFKELQIIGSRASTSDDYEPCIRLVAEGAVYVKPLITHTFELEKIKEGFELIEKHPGNVLRAVVKL
ncbi:MAG: alcohol dehydrogenase catalytic domain-containing protein [Nitrososphaerota archaeon]|nr:alcohol dehydrogenase catalytic domain-containing protein [Candidatus Bathyarchaeota archaeon]MDW8024204.1 alcohol dehydrogenase catalytic domain-containing protein [Nitrososphaerota archaeon]